MKKENNRSLSLKEWGILWFLYSSKKDYFKYPKTLAQLEKDMGYDKYQSGGIRLFLKELVKKGILIKVSSAMIDNSPRYIVNKKEIDDFVEKDVLYKIILSLEYGELKYSGWEIPLPFEIK